MDLTIDSSVTEARHDTRWRTSKHGQANGQPGTLDLTKFIEGTHYNIGGRKDNVIPSGVAVVLNGASGLYEPFGLGAWAATSAVALGERVLLASGALLVATTAGTSGAAAPTAPATIGGTVTDGTVVWTREAGFAGYINDDAGIPLFRRAGVAKSTKAGFSLLLHGILEPTYMPIAAQRAAVKTAPSTGSFTYI